MKKQITNIINEKGVTLIEIIMTMVITGILAAVAINRLKDEPALIQQKNAAKVALNDFRYAQEMAITHGKAVRIEVEVDNNQYAVKWNQTGSYLTNPVAGGPFIRKFGKDEFLYVTITNSQLPDGKITYGTSGKPFANGTALNTAKSALSINGQISLIVLPYTGKVKLENNE